MILTAFHGFCMALADSVPGVSGGTIAFILGFYERFLNALNHLFGSERTARGPALLYLVKLGVGWCIGLSLSLMLISTLIERHIYTLSSVFLGLTLASIPFIVRSELQTLNGQLRHAFFLPIGMLAVIAMTALRESPLISTSIHYGALLLPDYIYLFVTGTLAIGAMVLPGISGSSLLMIFGVYVPTVRAIRQLFSLHFSVLTGLTVLAFGFLIGIVIFARFIRTAMRKYRPQMIWLILGLMLGSLYAICLGPTTMEVPLAAMSLHNCSPSGILLGIVILFSLEALRHFTEKRINDSIS